jgi:hypothetical protein
MAQPGQQRYQRSDPGPPADLKTPVRNRYFYGKLLDAFHFELEQRYFNDKRWLLNRLVTGPGVVCGLDVELTSDKHSIVVLPGLAIDRCGREIIVPETSRPVELPPMPPYEPEKGSEYQARRQSKSERHDYCEQDYAHVLLCYHECESDPVPALAADCGQETLCAAGSIREQYKVVVREGYAPERVSNFPDVITGRRINYSAIVEFVTRNCRALPDDCCIPLANIRLRDVGDGWEPEIDINVRPIVYNNRLLYELLVALVKQEESSEY